MRESWRQLKKESELITWLNIFLVPFVSMVPDELSECRRLAPKYEAEVEVRLWDDTRVDLLSDEYAIEVDWASKWAESIGQALYYAEVTGKKPAVLLLVRNLDSDRRFVYRAQTVCARHGIRLFVEKINE